MRRFLVALSLAGLLVGVMSAGGAAKGPPSGAGLTADPTNVIFTMIPLGATEADYQTVVITNGTTNVLHYRSPGLLAEPFSVGMNTCATLNPQRTCKIWYRAGGSTAGTFKASVVQPFYWVDGDGGEHTVNVKLRFFVTVSTDQRPTADSQSVSAVAGVAKTLTLTGGDADGDALTFSIPNVPDHGAVGAISTPICSGTPSTCTAEVTYTPDGGFIGTDHVIFKTNDGLFDSNIAGTVTITVTAPTPVVTANPTALYFGEVTVGDFDQLGIEFTNTLASTLYMKSVTMSAPFTSNMSWTVCKAGLAADDSCVGYVTFTPLSADDFDELLTTTWTASDDEGAPVVATTTVWLHGTGV